MLRVRRKMSKSIVFRMDGVDPEVGVDAAELAQVLGGLTGLLAETAKASGESGTVSLKVRPFREGSFIVDLVMTVVQPLVDIFTTDEASAISNILAVVGFGAAGKGVVGVVRKIGGHVCDFRDNGDGTYSYGQDVVGPAVHAALQSPEVAECARKVVCGSFGGTIKAKNVTFNVMGGGTTTISADEAQAFSTFATEAKTKVPTDRSVSSVSHGVYLCPDSGSYHGGRSGYSFITPGDSGAVYRHVTIEDEEFLAKVASGDVRLGGGDMLRVDLRTEQSVGRNNRLTTSYAIERVLEYVKLPTQEQRTLFDDGA